MARWTRARRVRWLIAILVVAVVAALGAAVFLVQPDLSDARDRVDNTWAPLRAPLDGALRHRRAGGRRRSRDAGFAERSVTQDLEAALARWQKLALRGDTHTDPEREATTANELEAQMRRLFANIAASDKLKVVAAPDQPLGVGAQRVRAGDRGATAGEVPTTARSTPTKPSGRERSTRSSPACWGTSPARGCCSGSSESEQRAGRRHDRCREHRVAS